MNFKPSDAGLSDLWCVSWKGQAHVFYLSVRQPKNGESVYVNGIGHAVSDDLLHWKELPPAVIASPLGEPGDMDPWSGSCVCNDEGMYLYYTARSTKNQGHVQAIHLAISKDGVHFRNYPGNPVLKPDPNLFYHEESASKLGEVDCRDLSVVWDAESHCYYGYYAARIPSQTLCESAAIGVARSRDLICWEHCKKPALQPKQFGLLELPTVFHIGEKWYMTTLMHCSWNNRHPLGDPHFHRGTVYAVAEQPEGPFEFGTDYILSAGEEDGGAFSHCCMTHRGEYVALSCDRGPLGTATLSSPFQVLIDGKGRLRLGYLPATEGYRVRELLRPDSPVELSEIGHYGQVSLPVGGFEKNDNHYLGYAESGWQHALLPVEGKNLEVEATIHTKGVAAGILVGSEAVMVDCQRRELAVGNWKRHFMDERERPIQELQISPCTIRIRVRGHRMEVYLDGILVFQGGVDEEAVRQVGLIVDRSSAVFENISVWELEE